MYFFFILGHPGYTSLYLLKSWYIFMEVRTASSIQEVAATPMTYTSVIIFCLSSIIYRTILNILFAVLFFCHTLIWCLSAHNVSAVAFLKFDFCIHHHIIGIVFPVLYFIFIDSNFFPSLIIMKSFYNQMINFCGVKHLCHLKIYSFSRSFVRQLNCADSHGNPRTTALHCES